MKSARKIILEPFCFKQFDAASGSLFIDCDRELFTDTCD